MAKQNAAKRAAKQEKRQDRRELKQNKKSFLTYQPDNLSGSQAAQYQDVFESQGKKAGLKYLRSQGYRPKEIGKARLAGEAPMPMATQSQQWNLNNAKGAVAAGMDVSQTMADRNAQMNRPNEVGAFGGSQQWTQDENGNWIKTTSLSDVQQQMMGAEDQYSLGARQAGLAASQNAFNTYQQPYNYNGISDVMGGAELGDARNKAATSAYESQMALMRPEFQDQSARFEQMAAERGWVPGSKLYEKEKTRLQNQQDAQAKSIADNAYNQGLSEYNTMFNTSTSDRARQISEMNQMRDRPLTEASALMGQGTGIRQDQFTDYGAIQQQAVDPLQAYAVQNQANMATQQQKWQTGESALDRQNALAVAAMSKPATPSSGPSLAEQMQAARDQMAWEQANGFRPNYNQGAKYPSTGSQVASGIAQGVGMGVGAGLANAL